MSTSKTLILALSAALLTLACGGDDDEASPDSGSVFTNPDASVRTDAASGGGKDTGTDPSDDSDGGVVDEDGGGSEVDPDSGQVIICEAPSGCYACSPKTNLQFLNRCVSANAGITAVPFNNQARIPGYDPSKLPDLP